MRCFHHRDKEAVGTCNSCGKGLCEACTVDLQNTLACRGKCEERAKSIARLIDRNAEIMAAADALPTVQVIASMPELPPTEPPHAYVVSQLAGHTRTARLIWRSTIGLYFIVGLVLLGAALSARDFLMGFLGLLFVVAALVVFAQARRKMNPPENTWTETKGRARS